MPKNNGKGVTFNNNPNVKVFNNGSKKSLSAYNKLKQQLQNLRMQKQENNATRFLSKRGQQLNKFTSKNKGYNLAKYNLTRKMRNLKDENRNILKSWSRGNVNVSVNDISVLFKNPLTNDEKMLLKLTRDKMKERNKTSKNKQSKPLGFLDAIAAASAF